MPCGANFLNPLSVTNRPFYGLIQLNYIGETIAIHINRVYPNMDEYLHITCGNTDSMERIRQLADLSISGCINPSFNRGDPQQTPKTPVENTSSGILLIVTKTPLAAAPNMVGY